MALSAETKAKISATHIERFKQSLSERVEEPTHKRCARCKENKRVDEFTQVKRTLRSGLIAVFPHSPCKKCKAAKVKRRKERLQAEGVDIRALQRGYEANEDPERRKQRRREAEAVKRHKQGIEARGPYKHEGGAQKLPYGPIAAFLEDALAIHRMGQIAELTETSGRRLFAILNGEVERVSLRTVDRILTGLSCPEALHDLYPAESTKPAPGYHYLDPEGNPVNGNQAETPA